MTTRDNDMLNAIWARLAILRRVSKWVTTYRQGIRPSIAMFALRRGGSTLLADMLSSERGVMMVDEPFFVRESHPDYAIKSRWLRPRLHSEFFGLDDEDRQRVRGYVSALLAGELPIGVCRNPRFPFRADRMLLKMLYASALIAWLAESSG
jgi:hypothetical protein